MGTHGMTVGELKEWLADEPDGAEVLVETGGVLYESKWVSRPTMGVVSVEPWEEWVDPDPED